MREKGTRGQGDNRPEIGPYGSRKPDFGWPLVWPLVPRARHKGPRAGARIDLSACERYTCAHFAPAWWWDSRIPNRFRGKAPHAPARGAMLSAWIRPPRAEHARRHAQGASTTRPHAHHAQGASMVGASTTTRKGPARAAERRARARTRARASACGIARSAPSPDLKRAGQKFWAMKIPGHKGRHLLRQQTRARACMHDRMDLAPPVSRSGHSGPESARSRGSCPSGAWC